MIGDMMSRVMTTEEQEKKLPVVVEAAQRISGAI